MFNVGRAPHHTSAARRSICFPIKCIVTPLLSNRAAARKREIDDAKDEEVIISIAFLPAIILLHR